MGETKQWEIDAQFIKRHKGYFKKLTKAANDHIVGFVRVVGGVAYVTDGYTMSATPQSGPDGEIPVELLLRFDNFSLGKSIRVSQDGLKYTAVGTFGTTFTLELKHSPGSLALETVIPKTEPSPNTDHTFYHTETLAQLLSLLKPGPVRIVSTGPKSQTVLYDKSGAFVGLIMPFRVIRQEA